VLAAREPLGGSLLHWIPLILGITGVPITAVATLTVLRLMRLRAAMVERPA